MNGATSDGQLRRQVSWLGESWSWIMRTKVLEDRSGARPSALDVGCGPGLVMELFSPLMDVTGVDIDPAEVEKARVKGLRAVTGDALDLPFADGSFDIVYCSFTMLWVKDPSRAVKEMARVSRRSVVCLAEPDYGGRICCPKEIADLDGPLTASLVKEGADPYIGRKLGSLLGAAGLDVDLGVHSGVWSPEQLKMEADAEWDSLCLSVMNEVGENTLAKARSAWDAALADGTLFLFNPIFYAVGHKR